MPFPLDHTPFFDVTDVATPATYINAAGVSKDIEVDFQESPNESALDGVTVSNYRKAAIARTADVADWSKGAQLIEHALTENDDASGYMTDQRGQIIIAENINTWYIIDKQDDGAGTSQLILSLEPIQ